MLSALPLNYTRIAGDSLNLAVFATAYDTRIRGVAGKLPHL